MVQKYFVPIQISNRIQNKTIGTNTYFDIGKITYKARADIVAEDLESDKRGVSLAYRIFHQAGNSLKF